MPISPQPNPICRPRWPWLVLLLGLAWTAIIRIPLILNAEDHLDSDLAVDGLTLLDAVNGHWRWHYPGTPHIGILPVLASYPQAMAWGANPVALVSGGLVLWLMVVAATFAMAWKAFGPRVAAWSIVPLVFSSEGSIWLSGRITGGHLLALAWHILAFVGLIACLNRGGRRSAAMLGAWCGLGVYNDAMGLFTIVGIAVGAILARPSFSRAAIPPVAAFLGGIIIGVLPRVIGRWVDPYDAYPSQFAATFDPSAIAGHAVILIRDCLPRLLGGVRLRGMIAFSPFGWLTVLLMLAFAAALVRLAIVAIRCGEPSRRAAAGGTLTSALLIAMAFLVNKNIYNSDNYRYLVFLLTTWSLGFGLVLDDLGRLGGRRRVAAGLFAVMLIAGMTVDTFYWYRWTRSYLDGRFHPIVRRHPAWTDLVLVHDRPRVGRRASLIAERYAIPPDVTHVFGGYWDVYRLAFLSGGRVVGVPYPMYPNRFAGWSRGLGPGRGKILILRPGKESSSTRPASERSGPRSWRVHSAREIKWHPAMETAWRADGRAPAELGSLSVVVP